MPPQPSPRGAPPLRRLATQGQPLRDRILDDLARQDYAVVDNLIGSERCCALWRELNAVYEAGHMAPSRSSIRIGGHSFEFDKPNVFSISDFSCLDPEYREDPARLVAPRGPAPGAHVPLVTEFEAFLGGLLQQVFDGAAAGDAAAPLAIRNAHAKAAVSVRPRARAPTAAAYVPHFDNVALATDKRRVSAVYYANPLWAPGHGGLLRCYPLARGGRFDPHVVALEPVMDRLVLFRADVLLHDVTPFTPPSADAAAGAPPAAAADARAASGCVRPLPGVPRVPAGPNREDPRVPLQARRWAFVEWASEPAARALPDAVEKQARAKKEFAGVIRQAAQQTAALVQDLAMQNLLHPIQGHGSP